jgi:hypothetical protein
LKLQITAQGIKEIELWENSPKQISHAFSENYLAHLELLRVILPTSPSSSSSHLARLKSRAPIFQPSLLVHCHDGQSVCLLDQIVQVVPQSLIQKMDLAISKNCDDVYDAVMEIKDDQKMDRNCDDAGAGLCELKWVRGVRNGLMHDGENRFWKSRVQ